MSRKVIDLSIAIEPDLPSDPEMMIPQIDYADHVPGWCRPVAIFE